MQGFGKESLQKHGIADIQASRFGGMATILGVVLLLAILAPMGIGGLGDGPLNIDWAAWIVVVGCVALGFVEDCRNGSVPPLVRLGAKTLIWGVTLWLWPTLVPSSIGAPVIDQLLSIPALAFLLCLVFCVGFINAVNMADGANGLVASIVVMANIVFFKEFGGIGFLAVLTVFSVFLIFNVMSGRLFLGDAGAYGAGAILLVTSLFCYSAGFASLSFFAALLSYPCLDLLFSITRRFFMGRSITMPDNDHLHNRIHYQYCKVFSSPNMANSAAGLTVACASSGVVCVTYLADWLPITSGQWSMVFAAQCVLYVVAYYLTGKSAGEH